MTISTTGMWKIESNKGEVHCLDNKGMARFSFKTEEEVDKFISKLNEEKLKTFSSSSFDKDSWQHQYAVRWKEKLSADASPEEFDSCAKLIGKENLDIVLKWLFTVDDFWLGNVIQTPKDLLKTDKKRSQKYLESFLIRAKATNTGTGLPRPGDVVTEDEYNDYVRRYKNRHEFINIGFDKYQNPIYEYHPNFKES